MRLFEAACILRRAANSHEAPKLLEHTASIYEELKASNSPLISLLGWAGSGMSSRLLSEYGNHKENLVKAIAAYEAALQRAEKFPDLAPAIRGNIGVAYEKLA